MKEFPLDYLILPRMVARAVLSKKLKLIDLAVYAMIQSHEDEDGLITTTEELADWCGVGTEVAYDAVNRLRGMGFVRLVSVDRTDRKKPTIVLKALSVLWADEVVSDA